jgi:septum formation protein
MFFPPLALASRSPRRREMLSWLGLPFECLDGSINETPLPEEAPRAHVLRVAEEKARSAAREWEGTWTLISADTVVVDQGEILGKPADAGDAARMLEQLSGREHCVDTGLIIYNLDDGSITSTLCESRVRMRSLTAEEIMDYVRSGDPLDKAGAYAIQNRDFNPVPEFSGCMANVMGLPLCHLVRQLEDRRVLLKKNPPDVCKEHAGYDCPIWERVLAGEEIG